MYPPKRDWVYSSVYCPDSAKRQSHRLSVKANPTQANHQDRVQHSPHSVNERLVLM
ncbi:Uncharacterised protein [Vibrio cholerae]|nr:Uncharacterised protein [Vibrio cholerae]